MSKWPWQKDPSMCACVSWSCDLSRKTFLWSALLLPPFAIFLGTSYSSLFFLLLAFFYYLLALLLLLFKSLLLRNTLIWLLTVYPAWWRGKYNKWSKEILSAPGKVAGNYATHVFCSYGWLAANVKDFLKAKLSQIKNMNNFSCFDCTFWLNQNELTNILGYNKLYFFVL